MKTKEQIIDCGGVYEVHPGNYGGWAVVCSTTGEVVHNTNDKHQAVKYATECNAQ